MLQTHLIGTYWKRKLYLNYLPYFQERFLFTEKVWSDIVCRFVMAEVGIPMAYIAEAGVQVKPLPNMTCSGSGVISLIKATQHVTVENAKKCLL